MCLATKFKCALSFLYSRLDSRGLHVHPFMTVQFKPGLQEKPLQSHDSRAQTLRWTFPQTPFVRLPRVHWTAVTRTVFDRSTQAAWRRLFSICVLPTRHGVERHECRGDRSPTLWPSSAVLYREESTVTGRSGTGATIPGQGGATGAVTGTDEDSAGREEGSRGPGYEEREEEGHKEDMSFWRAAEILAVPPQRQKRLGFDFHLWQALTALLPGVAVYFTAMSIRKFRLEQEAAAKERRLRAEEERRGEMEGTEVQQQQGASVPGPLPVRNKSEQEVGSQHARNTPTEPESSPSSLVEVGGVVQSSTVGPGGGAPSAPPPYSTVPVHATATVQAPADASEHSQLGGQGQGFREGIPATWLPSSVQLDTSVSRPAHRNISTPSPAHSDISIPNRERDSAARAMGAKSSIREGSTVYSTRTEHPHQGSKLAHKSAAGEARSELEYSAANLEHFVDGTTESVPGLEKERGADIFQGHVGKRDFGLDAVSAELRRIREEVQVLREELNQIQGQKEVQGTTGGSDK